MTDGTHAAIHADLRAPELNFLCVLSGGTPLQDLLYTDGVVQFDFFYTRSAGRLIDWYASGGIDQRPIRESVFNNVIDTETKPSIEGGVRARFPLTDRMKRWLRVPFVGGRLGWRTSSFSSMNEARLVVEFGLGAW